jgi:histone H3/H4
VTHANKAKRKTLAVKDIISAMTDMEFDLFIKPLNEALKS